MPRPADFVESEHTAAELDFSEWGMGQLPEFLRENVRAVGYLCDRLIAPDAELPEWLERATVVLAGIHASRNARGIFDPWPHTLAILAIPAAFWAGNPSDEEIRHRILARAAAECV